MKRIAILDFYSKRVADDRVNDKIKVYEDKGFTLDTVKVNETDQTTEDTVDFHQTVTLVFQKKGVDR